ASLLLFAVVAGALVVVVAASLFLAKSSALLSLPHSLLGYGAAYRLGLTAELAATLLAALHGLGVAEIMLVTALAIFFSSFSTPLTTGVFTLGVWLIGRSGDAMADVSSRALTTALQELLRGLVWVAPNFNLFVPGRTILTSARLESGVAAYLGATVVYGGIYAGLLLVAGSVLFGRRDLP